MSHDLTSTRRITKSNVENAIQLLMKHNVKKKRRKDAEANANDRKVAQHCKSFQGNQNNRTSVVGFSKSLVLTEMQSYVARQDWKHALHLLPKFLEYPIELEPLVWRYLFIILLHTNDPLYLRQFFERCIGSHSSNNDVLLKSLLLLPLKE